jgi:ATP/maltotriose-dependent transcriptional regulator MalT
MPITTPFKQVRRKAALQQCALLHQSDMRALLVQAQAGQGKTTLVSQFEDESGHPFAWITCTGLDTDPSILFQKTLKSCADACALLQKDAIETTLRQELSPHEFIDLAGNILGSALDENCKPLTLVFDDAHLLSESPLSLSHLKNLYLATHDRIAFILLTRFPLRINEEPLFDSHETLIIDDSVLAMNREEIAELYNEVLGAPVGTRRVNDLHQITEGWVAGLLLLRFDQDIKHFKGANDAQSLTDYFDLLISQDLTEQQLKELALFSFLPELPEAFIERFGSRPVRQWIREMAERQYFLRIQRQKHETVFRFHRLLQAYFSRKGDELLSQSEIEAFLREIGYWYLEKGDIEDGLSCLKQARAWQDMEVALSEHSFQLLSSNKSLFLKTLLESTPEDIRHASPWISYNLGMGRLATSPTDALPPLTRSMQLFKELGNDLGELGTLYGMLSYQLYVDGRFGRSSQLLNRAVELFERLNADLTAEQQEFYCTILSIASCHCQANLANARRFAAIGRAQNTRGHGSFLEIAESLFMLLEGRVQEGLDCLAPVFSHSNASHTSLSNRIMISTLALNLLVADADFENYRQLKQDCIEDLSELFEFSYLGLFTAIWDVDILISEGRYSDALKQLEKTLNHPGAQSPHIRSQLLHYSTLARSFLGQESEMEQSMRLALQQRAIAGAPIMLHLTHCLVGASMAIIGRYDEAKRILTLREKHPECCIDLYHSPIINVYRALSHFISGNSKECSKHLRRALQYMREKRTKHFFGWSRDIMAPLLGYAVRTGIESDYARHLARIRLGMDILDSGKLVPLLTVNILGGVRLKCQENMLPESEFTPMMQRLITLLATRPGMIMDIEQAADCLWPESDRDSARNNLDVMLSRLRQRIAQSFGKEIAKRFIIVSRA